MLDNVIEKMRNTKVKTKNSNIGSGLFGVYIIYTIIIKSYVASK